MIFTDQAFILSSFDLSEKDRVFDIYSKNHGRLKVIAKSVKKEGSNFSSALQYFNILLIEVATGTNFEILRSVKILREYSVPFSKDYNLFEKGSELLKPYIKYITEYNYSETALWDLTKKGFELLIDSKDNEKGQLNILEYYKKHFNSICGY